MRTLFAFLAALSLSGCAGLTTMWVLHIEYMTPQDTLPTITIPQVKPAEKATAPKVTLL